MKNRYCMALATSAMGVCLIASSASGQTFSNATLINIPAGQPGVTVGPAAPYPSTISVAGLGSGGNLADVNLIIPNIVHTWADDVDMVLVGPSGVAVVILSDAGGSVAFDPPGPHSYTIDDAAAAAFPSGAAANGTYRPTNIGAADTWVAPGPGALTQATPLLSNFNNTNGNGTWSLYIVDDVGGDPGTMASGWSIALTAGGNNCVLALPHPWCVSDVNNDNAVNINDLLDVINNWGQTGPPRPTGDVDPLPNGNCTVDINDLLAVINAWGACPLPTGACCGIGGACTTVSAAACQSSGGTYQGNGVSCGSVVCPNIPANDNCGGAFTLVTGTNQVPGVNNGTNTNATNGTVQSSAACPLGGSTFFTRDVWYKHVVPNTPGLQGQILALKACDTIAPFTDTVLAVYQQNSPLNCFDAGGMTMIACNDDACNGLRSQLETPIVAPGTTLYIRMGSWSTGATNQGPFIMTAGLTDISSDICIGAQTLAIGGSATDVLGTARQDLGPSCARIGCAGPPVAPGIGRWYKIVGNGQTLTASTCTSASDIFDGRLSVFCGVDCGTLQCGPATDCDIGLPQQPSCPAFQGETVSFCTAVGTTYWLLVHAADIPTGVAGNFTLTLTTSGFPCAGSPNCGPPPPPVNDLCANAVAAIAGNNVFNNTGATDSGPTACAAITRDVWFNYTVPNAPATCGLLYLSTQGSIQIADTVMAVYGATCPTVANSHIACNDDAVGLYSVVQIPVNNSGAPGTVAPGAQIKIRVGSWSTAVTNQGAGNLYIQCLPP